MSELYPGSRQLPLMKYNGKPSKTLIDAAFANQQWVAQEKKDGALYMLEKIDNEHIYLFARTKSRKTGELVEKHENVPHIVEWAQCLPDDTTVLGEIYVPGGHSNNVTSVMGCTPSNAQTRQYKSDQYGGPIHYYIFDCLRFAGQDCTNQGFVQRFGNLIEFFITQEPSKYVELAKVYERDFSKILQTIFDRGGEGLVFKRRDALYEPGKRPTQTYFKMKESIDTIDLVCMGFEDPVRPYTGKEIETWPYWIERGEQDQNGAFQWYNAERNCYEDYQHNPQVYAPVTKYWYYGWKGSLILGLYKDGELVKVGTVSSGLTDELRAAFAEHPEDYIGEVVELTAMSTTKDGALRHPVFLGFRDDKNAKDCLYEDVFK